MSDYEYVLYEPVEDGRVVRVMLNRPEARNAQNRGMLVELHDAMLRAEADDEVRVVIMGGTGPMFSSGHDMGSKVSMEELMPGPKQHPSRQVNGGTRKGAENLMLQEWHHFFENTRRWRNLRKLGMCGVEYFAHPWEFGPRKAKELLLTGDAIDAEEAHRLGMISKVFPADRLESDTIALAQRIAETPTMAALLIKEAVNQTQDNMGFYNSLNACFTLHELNHSHWAQVHENGYPIALEEDGIPNWKDAPPIVVAEKDTVRAEP